MTATTTATTALYVENGMNVVLPDGSRRFIASAHYSGPIDGSGIITFCWVDGTSTVLPADTAVHLIGDVPD